MRPITLDDVDELVTLDSDPEVMRYLAGGRATPADEVAELIRKQIGALWMAYEAVTLEFVGWFGLDPSGEDAYEVGYRLRLRAWGRGLAREGARALIEAAFRQLDAHRCLCTDNGCEHPVPTRNGTMRDEIRAHVPPAVGRPDRGNGIR